MKKVKRNIYLYEFEAMTYRQRFYYLWKNELSVKFPDINANPLNWCLLDALKLCYLPVLCLVFVPLLALLCANEARRLKFRYKYEEDRSWYKSNCIFIE